MAFASWSPPIETEVRGSVSVLRLVIRQHLVGSLRFFGSVRDSPLPRHHQARRDNLGGSVSSGGFACSMQFSSVQFSYVGAFGNAPARRKRARPGGAAPTRTVPRDPGARAAAMGKYGNLISPSCYRNIGISPQLHRGIAPPARLGGAIARTKIRLDSP